MSIKAFETLKSLALEPSSDFGPTNPQLLTNWPILRVYLACSHLLFLASALLSTHH